MKKLTVDTAKQTLNFQNFELSYSNENLNISLSDIIYPHPGTTHPIPCPTKTKVFISLYYDLSY